MATIHDIERSMDRLERAMDEVERAMDEFEQRVVHYDGPMTEAARRLITKAWARLRRRWPQHAPGLN
ncbi:MAG: hypothetical protein HY701_09830 [Gemmatimonadetes bacterium]|nr:hypothetical protein [Gemmatimonadota bacterium]